MRTEVAIEMVSCITSLPFRATSFPPPLIASYALRRTQSDDVVAAHNATEYNKVLVALQCLQEKGKLGSYGSATTEGDLVPEEGELAKLGMLMSPMVAHYYGIAQREYITATCGDGAEDVHVTSTADIIEYLSAQTTGNAAQQHRRRKACIASFAKKLDW